MNIFVEAVVIGIALLVVFAVIHFILMKVWPDQAMKHVGIFLAVFLAAMVFHLLAEVSGFNKKFCDMRK